MYNASNDEQASELAMAHQEVLKMEKDPTIQAYNNAVKNLEKLKTAIKWRINKWQEFGDIGWWTFVNVPDLWYTPEVLFEQLGDRANEYMMPKVEIDKKKIEEDIKEWILPKELQTKRVVLWWKLYWREIKEEVQDTFNIE